MFKFKGGVVWCGEAKHNRQLQLGFKISQRASRYPNELQELLCATSASALGNIAWELTLLHVPSAELNHTALLLENQTSFDIQLLPVASRISMLPIVRVV